MMMTLKAYKFSLIRQVVAMLICISLSVSLVSEVVAKGLGGRTGGGRANVGGARPNMAARPSMQARPNMGARPSVGTRPNMGNTMAGQAGGRPQIQRPQTSMPHLGNTNTMSRPNLNTSKPLPNFGNQRDNLVDRKPSSPSLPQTRPGLSVPDRGNLGDSIANRPSTLPGRAPGLSRPNIDRPSMPDFDRLPNGRPSGGELGDFLGIERPIGPGTPNRPGRPTTLPGEIERPGDIGRPGDITRPGDIGSNRPDRIRPDNRPRPENRLPVDRRPSIDIGDVNIGNNTAISVKPKWVNIDNRKITSINQRWQNQIGNATTLPALAPNRFDHFHTWGNHIRGNWHVGHYGGCFRPDWWTRHRFHCGGWHYFYSYSFYPYTYWWSTPTFGDVTSWFAWTTAASLRQPVYYDYGAGGNVTYEDNRVYITGQEIAAADEFAESAAVLATVPEPESEKEAEAAEWLPLGTFALTTDPDDIDPDRILQLAVNRDGVVSGTLYNRISDQTQAVQGRVDKETQRVAMRIGESENVIAETGLYNLTQDEASILVHFGKETQESYLLVRLPSPEDTETSN